MRTPLVDNSNPFLLFCLPNLNKNYGEWHPEPMTTAGTYKTTFVGKEETLGEFLEGIDKLASKLSRVKVGLTEQMYPLHKESYHLLTHFLKPDTKYDRLLYSHIFKSVYQTELMSAGGGYTTVMAAIGFTKLLSKLPEVMSMNHYELMEHNQEQDNKVEDLIATNAKRVTPLQLELAVKQICEGHPDLGEAVWEAIQLAGMEGNIHLEDSQQSVYGVELRHGYSFRVNPFKFFLGSLGTWEVYNCKVMCVDGIIERVSELDKVLMRSADTKIPLLLVAQGFSEEVIATIKTNNDRGTFMINPVRLEQSLENLNVLNDISVAAGGDVVSVLKGQLLVYVDYDTLPVVQHVKVTEGELLIRNSSTRSGVATQIKHLLEKRNTSQRFEQFNAGDLIENRISNLISHSVVIRLPNFSQTEREGVKTKIDISLRTARTILTHGVIYRDELIHAIQLKQLAREEGWWGSTTWGHLYLQTLIRVLGSQEQSMIPALTLYAGMRYGISTMIHLLGAGGTVVSSY